MNCDAINCDRPAVYAYSDPFGDIHVCEFHGGPGMVDGWTRIMEGDNECGDLDGGDS